MFIGLFKCTIRILRAISEFKTIIPFLAHGIYQPVTVQITIGHAVIITIKTDIILLFSRSFAIFRINNSIISGGCLIT